MSTNTNERSSHEIIEQEKSSYLAGLSGPEPEWPTDVRLVYDVLRDRLFDLGLEAQDVVEKCGISDHNVYSRFKYFTGHGIKELILLHRLELAKRLLKQNRIPIARIALAVGYENPSGFSSTFKRWEGCCPSEFQAREEA